MKTINKEGLLTALSHTFRLVSGDVFILELECEGERQHVLVRRPHQLQWRHTIQVHTQYRITNLRLCEVKSEKCTLNIMVASSKSQLIKVGDAGNTPLLTPALHTGLISYKGVVSSVEDEDAGIYMLDGRVQLVITYLKDITCELWNGRSALLNEEEVEGSAMNERTPQRMAEDKGTFKEACGTLEGDIYGSTYEVPREGMVPKADMQFTDSWLPDGQQVEAESGGRVKKSMDTTLYRRSKRKLDYNQIQCGAIQDKRNRCKPQHKTTQDSTQDNENQNRCQTKTQKDNDCQNKIQHTSRGEDQSQDNNKNQNKVHGTTPEDKTQVTSDNKEEDVRHHQCLMEGDSVTVYQAHHERKEGRPRLVCCGRSLVINTSRKFALGTWEVKKFPLWVMDTLHNFSPGVGGLGWLLSLQSQALHSLTPTLLPPSHLQWRKCDGEVGLLTRLVAEAADRHMLVKGNRSVIDEFLLPNHQCPFTKKFETPFELVTISYLSSALMDEVQQEEGSGRPSVAAVMHTTDDQSSGTRNGSVTQQDLAGTGELLERRAEEKIERSGQDETGKEKIGGGEMTEEYRQEEKQVWNCRITHTTHPRRVVLGKLVTSASGELQLQQEQESITLIFSNPEERPFDKISFFVAIFEGDLVVEVFNIMQNNSMHNIQKRYLIVSDMAVLLKNFDDTACNIRDHVREFTYSINSKSADSVKNQPEEFIYNMKVLSKSPLVYSHLRTQADNIERLLQERFFIARVMMTKIEKSSGEEVERWQKFARFQGRLAGVYYVLQEGDVYKLLMPSTVDVNFVLKKTLSNTCLKMLSKHFTSSECIHLPENTVIRKIASEKCHDDAVRVKSVLNGSVSHSPGLTTVSGVVKMKCFMSPKFSSEISHLNIDICNLYHIGVPGSKVVRLLLADKDDPTSEVWLYLPGVSYSFIYEYSLGIIPGVQVLATCVERKVAKTSRRIYLQGSVYTRVVPLTPCDRSLVQDRLKILTPSFHCLSDPPSQYNIFSCFVCVSRIMKVTVRAVCGFCDAEMVQGLCSYVGCHAPPSGKVATSAEVMVDDGTGTALMFIDTLSHIETLLKLSASECSQLSHLVLRDCQDLSFVVRRKSNRDIEDSSQKTEDGNGTTHTADKAFEELCTRSELLRPMKLTCRKMSGVPRQSDLIHLYCLDLASIRPSQDAIELQKQLSILANTAHDM
ncbi:hypothetical protein Pcinc_005841 [Petrolisthes cinctipes]|uniref:CST complex subunit CTC1 n=1 Tax=Petrolisthes cinctipes TaxID=88211 RepID=A0AAE1KYN1_PETCI|nr:hypothetical protein Pcinc_005841 [Petrolisthes cinctipes]